jgi:3-deoxy-D-manno-octulosonic-acid transferase
MPTLAVSDRIRGKRRPELALRWGRELPPVTPDGVWMQAVSVGEVEIGRRVLSRLHQRCPELGLVMTSTTATGLDRARATVSEWPVAACPLDLPGPVRRVLAHARPRLVGLVETELWPELLHQCGRAGVPVMVLNGRLSDRSFRRYRSVRSALRPLLRPIAAVLVRATSDAERFAALGIEPARIEVVGNIKYDLEPDRQPLPWAERTTRGRRVIVAGSTMEGEERAVVRAWRQLAQRPLLIVAPRHPERFEKVAGLLDAEGLSWVRRTVLDDDDGGAGDRAEVILLDTIGELARVYAHATVAYVGGSLSGTGGHNPLEASAWGVPVVSGPDVFNFHEVYEELVEAGGAALVADADQLFGAFAGLLDDPGVAHAVGELGRQVVASNRGAVERTVDRLEAMLGGAR